MSLERLVQQEIYLDAAIAQEIQICRRLQDIASLMDWKRSRIFCHAYFLIFFHFDEEEKKALFDVPIRVREEIGEFFFIHTQGWGSLYCY